MNSSHCSFPVSARQQFVRLATATQCTKSSGDCSAITTSNRNTTVSASTSAITSGERCHNSAKPTSVNRFVWYWRA